MSNERLDRHSEVHHELFDEDTNQVGSLGDIVEKHAGDAIFLGPSEHSAGGADGGLADFEAEALATDPSEDIGDDTGDLFSTTAGTYSVDQTGTVAGIARGFGTHLPQDLGNGGFQVEEMPDRAMSARRPLKEGEELDDYDDDDDTNGKFDDGDLGINSQPGMNAVDVVETEAMPDRIHVHAEHSVESDDQLDATRRMK